MLKFFKQISRREFLKDIFYLSGILICGNFLLKNRANTSKENFKEAYFYKRLKK